MTSIFGNHARHRQPASEIASWLMCKARLWSEHWHLADMAARIEDFPPYLLADLGLPELRESSAAARRAALIDALRKELDLLQ